MRTLASSFPLLLTGLLFLGCDGTNSGQAESNDKMLIYNNFDELRGWIDNTAGSLTKQQAHSGRYSLTVGGGPEYSLTFRHPFGDLTASKPRKLRLQAWVRIEAAATPAQLVVEVTKPGSQEQVFRRAINLVEHGEPGKWTELKADLIMPETIAYDQVLVVYLWANTAVKAVYMDDLRIATTD